MNQHRKRLSDLVNMDDPHEVIVEVKTVVNMILPDFNFQGVENVYEDLIRLFKGQYPGYRGCNTRYHNFKHTSDALLAMTRLMHGASVSGKTFNEDNIKLGLVSAMMHDTGYIQKESDIDGTGAKYTLTHVQRSIDFMVEYFKKNGYLNEHIINGSNILKCTGLTTEVDQIPFMSSEIKILGNMLGTADLVGQIADQTYLEKLIFLYHEFKEANIKAYINEFDLLQKTIYFYEETKKRLADKLGNVSRYLPAHFELRFDIRRDLYKEAMDHNIDYLQYILEQHKENYREMLKRGRLPDYGV